MERKEAPVTEKPDILNLQREIETLRQEKMELVSRLGETEETLRAIQSGEVDALVVSTSQGDQVFTLKGADHSFKVLIENMSEGAVIKAKEGVILYANKGFARMVKKPLEKVIGSLFTDFLSSGDREVLHNFLQKEFNNRRLAELYLTASSGNLIPVQLSFIKLQTEDMLDNICIVVTDLTEHKQMEASKNAENIARIKKAEAERSSLGKSRFLAQVSHEIRNPLNVIIGMADLITKTTDAWEQAEYLDSIKTSAASLRALLNDILDYSSTESHHIKLTQVTFNLSQKIEKLFLHMLPQARNKGLNLKWAIDPEIPMVVHGDPVRLGQIILNIVGNAIKFTEKGEVDITVTLDGKAINDKSSSANIVPVLFSVRDTGRGIPQDKLSQIFNLFYQAHDIDFFEDDGTGLGLSISKKLVKLMGGSIEVESEENRGTIFRFTIPFSLPDGSIAADEEAAPSMPEEQHACPLPGEESAALNILLVEDKPMNQKLVKAYLDKKGHNTYIASNGKEALEIYSSVQLDLILMDINMPVMNGLEATRSIRFVEKDKGMHTPIVAMTAYAMEADRKKYLQAGMDYYITKPISPEILYDTLEQIAKR